MFNKAGQYVFHVMLKMCQPLKMMLFLNVHHF